MKYKPNPESKPFLEDPESPSPPNPFHFKKNEYYASQKPVKKEKTWSQYFKDQVQNQTAFHVTLLCFLFLHMIQIRSLQHRLFKLENELHELKSLNEHAIELPRENKVIQDILKSVISPIDTVPTELISRDNSSLNSEFNAASLILGATLETELSSHSIPVGDGFFDKVSFTLGSDQSAYVLLDRNPIYKKSWCSDDKEPLLTVNLAEPIKPTGVSYQQFKFYGNFPNDAPKRYDVVSCINDNCTITEPLASNCKYIKSIEQSEQICPVSTSISSVNRVQFRIHENYGNPKKTCVYLVRVYGEPSSPRKDKLDENPVELKKSRSELCTRLAWLHKNIKVFYNGLASKNCSTLYTNECCDECPECCAECQINDGNFLNYFQFFLIFFILIFVLFPFYIAVISACCFWLKRYI